MGKLLWEEDDGGSLDTDAVVVVVVTMRNRVGGQSQRRLQIHVTSMEMRTGRKFRCMNLCRAVDIIQQRCLLPRALGIRLRLIGRAHRAVAKVGALCLGKILFKILLVWGVDVMMGRPLGCFLGVFHFLIRRGSIIRMFCDADVLHYMMLRNVELRIIERGRSLVK
jgi:hypothetical protein